MTSFGPALDVVISLIFIFLLLSLIATAAQELYATKLNWRGRLLRQGLWELLLGNGPVDRRGRCLFASLWAHALVTAGRDNTARDPSYVSAQNLAVALIDVLVRGYEQVPEGQRLNVAVNDLPTCPAREMLLVLVARANGNTAALQAGIEAWFNQAMDRLSGSYKRSTQKFSIVFGLAVAVGLNVDTIGLARTLWTTPATSHAIADLAQRELPRFIPQTPPAAAPSPVPQGAASPVSVSVASAVVSPADAQRIADQARAIIETLPLPIGWNAKSGAGISPTCAAVTFYEPHATTSGAPPEASVPSLPAQFCQAVVGQGFAGGLRTLAGWLVTALAISIGAPFWFGILQSLVNLRGSGPRPPS